jgi:hypothetical protein
LESLSPRPGAEHALQESILNVISTVCVCVLVPDGSPSDYLHQGSGSPCVLLGARCCCPLLKQRGHSGFVAQITDDHARSKGRASIVRVETAEDIWEYVWPEAHQLTYNAMIQNRE